MIHKKKIIAIIGRSGSGKTTACEFIERECGIPMIESYTDRPRRYEGERGHTFVTPEEFDAIDKDDMIAYTKFGENRYCCLHEDVEDINTYVIDEIGMVHLREKVSNLYDIHTIYIHRQEKKRREYVDIKRIERDHKMFTAPPEDYDYIVDNNSTFEDFYIQLLKTIRTITRGDINVNRGNSVYI